MQRSRFVVRHRVLVSLLALVATLASLVGAPSVVGAQYYDVYSNAPYKELAGLEQAIQRLYQGESELNINADIARFDT